MKINETSQPYIKTLILLFFTVVQCTREYERETYLLSYLSSFYQGGGPDNTVPTVTLPVQGPPLRGNLWPGQAGLSLRREPRTPFLFLIKLNTLDYISCVFSNVLSTNCLQHFSLQMYCYSSIPYSLLCLWLFTSIICLSVWCYSLIILNCYKACLQLNIFMNCLLSSSNVRYYLFHRISKVCGGGWDEHRYNLSLIDLKRATMRHREMFYYNYYCYSQIGSVRSY